MKTPLSCITTMVIRLRACRNWKKTWIKYLSLSFIFLLGVKMFWINDNSSRPNSTRDKVLESEVSRNSRKKSEIDNNISDFLKFSSSSEAQNNAKVREKLLSFNFLVPPSKLKYNLIENNPKGRNKFYLNFKKLSPSYIFINSIVQDLFKIRNGTSGFFIEAGAFDGEYLSNTLWLEKNLNWTGLLVEADKDSYYKLLKKHRKSWISPLCVAVKEHPYKEIFASFSNSHTHDWASRGAARVIQPSDLYSEIGPGFTTYSTVLCLPFSHILDALGVTHVDFFSLDIEGLEIGVLRTFPFDRFTVDVWVIEHVLTNVTSIPKKNLGRKINYEDSELVNFMHKKGYYFFDLYCQVIADYIFVRKNSDIYRQLEVPAQFSKRKNICSRKIMFEPKKMNGELKNLRDQTHWPNIKFKVTKSDFNLQLQ